MKRLIALGWFLFINPLTAHEQECEGNCHPHHHYEYNAEEEKMYHDMTDAPWPSSRKDDVFMDQFIK
jgi:hypothetical protein